MSTSVWVVFARHEGLYYDLEPIRMFTNQKAAQDWINIQRVKRQMDPDYGYPVYELEEWAVYDRAVEEVNHESQ